MNPKSKKVMNKSIIQIVLGVVAGVIIAYLIFERKRQPIVETVTVIERDTVLIRDTVTLPPPPPTVIGEKPVQAPNGTIVELPVNRYRGTQTFPGSGATLTYELDAIDLFRTHFDLTVPKVTETKTIKETIILPAKSKLFVGGGLDFNSVTKSPELLNVSLLYNRRNKWALGFGINHNLTGVSPGLSWSGRIYIGL